MNSRARVEGALVIAVSLAWVATGALAAPPAPPAPSATTVAAVTVRATPAAPPSRVEAVQAFIRTHAVVSRTGRMARWRQPICPITFGGTDGDDAFVTARILAVAKSAGAPINPSASCVANIEVIFTPYPQQLIARIADRHPLYVGYHYQAQRKAILAFDRPIKSWYVTGTRGYGSGQSSEPTMGTAGSDAATGKLVIDESWGQSPGGSGESRLDASLTGELVNALIIVDQTKVSGRTIGSIADYAAMLALSQPAAPDTCGALDSILDLFASACRAGDAPQALTATDTAYLAALYKVNLDLPASIARGTLAAAMRGRS